MKNSALFLCLFTATSLFAGPLPKAEESQLSGYGWKMPSELTEARLERLLGEVVDRIHGVGFRYLGVSADFDHGHLLFEAVGTGEARALYPRAILYHTQEHAHAAHWKEDGEKKFDYLDVTTRNWIQWLSDDPKEDGRDLRNARVYLDATQKDPTQFFDETLAPKKEWHYTIHSRNLDAKKIGFELAGELQFEFYEASCTEHLQIEYDQSRGPIRVNVPGQKELCLRLTTNNPMMTLPWGK
jgi:hypothetical protein